MLIQKNNKNYINTIMCLLSVSQQIFFFENVLLNNCLIRAPKDKLLVLRGLDNYIVIDEGDVLLVYPKDKEQEIKKVTEEIDGTENESFL